MILERDQIPTSKEDLFLSSARRRTIRQLQYSTYKSDMLPISQKDLYIHGKQLVDYSENIRLLRYSKKQIKTANIKATSRSAVNLKESTIHQNVKSTPIDTRIHKNQEDITTNSLSLWCRLQATDNLISDGFHLRNILREFLLRAANGNPIAKKGQ